MKPHDAFPPDVAYAAGAATGAVLRVLQELAPESSTFVKDRLVRVLVLAAAYATEGMSNEDAEALFRVARATIFDERGKRR